MRVMMVLMSTHRLLKLSLFSGMDLFVSLISTSFLCRLLDPFRIPLPPFFSSIHPPFFVLSFFPQLSTDLLLTRSRLFFDLTKALVLNGPPSVNTNKDPSTHKRMPLQPTARPSAHQACCPRHPFVLLALYLALLTSSLPTRIFTQALPHSASPALSPPSSSSSHSSGTVLIPLQRLTHK